MMNEISSRFCGVCGAPEVMMLSCCCTQRFRRSPGVASRCDDCVHVQDEGDAAVAENGRSRDTIDRAIIRLDTFDDDLPLPEDFFDKQRGPRPAVVLDQE